MAPPLSPMPVSESEMGACGGEPLVKPKLPSVEVLKGRIEKAAKRAAQSELSRQMDGGAMVGVWEFRGDRTSEETVAAMIAMWGCDTYVAEAVGFATSDEGKILIMGQAQKAAEESWLKLCLKYEGKVEGLPNPFHRRSTRLHGQLRCLRPIVWCFVHRVNRPRGRLRLSRQPVQVPSGSLLSRSRVGMSQTLPCE